MNASAATLVRLSLPAGGQDRSVYAVERLIEGDAQLLRKDAARAR
jgi:hypothetical protein